MKVFTGMKIGDGDSSDVPTEVHTPKSSDEDLQDPVARAHVEEKRVLERLNQETEKKARKFKHLGEERAGGYVVVYQRAGRGTLHRLGEGVCWMAKKRSFVKSEIYSDCPEPEQYSTRCRFCWRCAADEEDGSTLDPAALGRYPRSHWGEGGFLL